MDAMEDMDILTGSNPTMAECSLLGKGVLTGLRQRHLGKSGLKASLSSLHHDTVDMFYFGSSRTLDLEV